MPRLTDAERYWRQAERKAAAMNARAREQAGPLFADQVEQTTPAAEYWRWRQLKAQATGGTSAAELQRVGRRWSLYVLRRIARAHMSPEDFAAADSQRWAGDSLDWWRKGLLGQARLVLSYERVSLGRRPVYAADGRPLCEVERVELREAIVSPPPGWQPPLTGAELDALLIESAYDMGQYDVDPLNLAAA